MRNTDSNNSQQTPPTNNIGDVYSTENAPDWNDYAKGTVSVDRSGLWPATWDSLAYDPSRPPESPIKAFYRNLMEELYKNQDTQSIEKNPTTYLLLLRKLETKRYMLTTNWPHYAPEQDDIVFELFSHQVVGLIYYWEKNNFSRNIAEHILEALCFLTSSVSSSLYWVSNSNIFPKFSEWERIFKNA